MGGGRGEEAGRGGWHGHHCYFGNARNISLRDSLTGAGITVLDVVCQHVRFPSQLPFLHTEAYPACSDHQTRYVYPLATSYVSHEEVVFEIVT